MVFTDLDVLAVGRGRARRLGGVRPATGTAPPHTRLRASWRAPPDAARASRPSSPSRAPTPNPSPTSRPCAERPSCTISSSGRLSLEWADARLVRDDPAKTLDTEPAPSVLLLPELLRGDRPGRAARSTSFRPTSCRARKARRRWRRSRARGVSVRVLTNSLESTEANLVHAGYAKRREDAAPGGRAALRAQGPTAVTKPNDEKAGLGVELAARPAREDLRGRTASRIFVGSFNFDLRSALLNTEMGLVIDSPALAQRLAEVFDSTGAPRRVRGPAPARRRWHGMDRADRLGREAPRDRARGGLVPALRGRGAVAAPGRLDALVPRPRAQNGSCLLDVPLLILRNRRARACAKKAHSGHESSGAFAASANDSRG